MAKNNFYLNKEPKKWQRCGVVLKRGDIGGYDSSVTGDPCIVWDKYNNCYHMFYFAQTHIDGKESNCNAHAISLSATNVGPGMWKKLGKLKYKNPENLLGDTHKPWILMDAYQPSIPIKIEGEYWLFTVSFNGKNKVIQKATSPSLNGPWKVIEEPVLNIGKKSEFDGYHVDTVTAYWFEKRKTILIFYKGYPLQEQVIQKKSPYGSSCAAAIMNLSDKKAEKIGKIIAPSNKSNHWTSGWVSTLQIFPASKGGWYGLLTGSPTPPVPVNKEEDMREPAPSLGGWAYTPEDWPVSAWEVAAFPIEWIDSIPKEARDLGEKTNLWRHHMLILPNGEKYLYYNSGDYGSEQMFLRYSSEG